MGEYLLRCVSDGSVQPPNSLSCPNDSSLLRSYYQAKQLHVRQTPGIWRFLDWLPVQGTIPEAVGAPITYRSLGLARELGLENLYISFNGYWPERGAKNPTCSFKDLEAGPTMQMIRERGGQSQSHFKMQEKIQEKTQPETHPKMQPTLVVASAGNTARAFAHIASISGLPLILFVPEKALFRMWLTIPAGPVKLIAVQGDYYDAILVAEKVLSLPGYIPEGGARNIARRDGMGTVMLDAAISIGHIPRHYFQAVGSGTGGISAWEAALRLKEDGRFGSSLSRLHLAQNLPNAPIYYSWKEMKPQPTCSEMFDDVLFNRKPPYAISGGVRDALQATDGEVYGITDQQAEQAKKLFEESEGIDILNAAAVAVAALEQAARAGEVSGKDSILLNITGGGVSRIKEDCSLHMLAPDLTVTPDKWEQAVQFLEGEL